MLNLQYYKGQKEKRMEKERINLLWISDLVVPTGFSRVSHGILSNIPRDKYNIVGLGVNYRGDPHGMSFPIYPAMLGGDLYGINRVGDLLKNFKIDLIFILNDIWIVNEYLNEIKRIYTDKTKIPKIVVYFPVDGKGHSPIWYKNLDIVKKAYTYTEFGRKIAEFTYPYMEFGIVPHGIEKTTFHQLFDRRARAKEVLYSGATNKDISGKDAFIFLNANRNQPRKRLELTMEGFKLFSEGKPSAVSLYMHCFVPGTNIYTDIGIKNIEDITKNDLVITHSGIGHKVTNLYTREYKGKLLKIKSVGNEDIFVTKEHPFYSIRSNNCPRKDVGKCYFNCSSAYKIINSGKLSPSCHYRYFENYSSEWIMAKDLKVGDYLVFRGNSLTKKDEQVPIELARLLGFFVAEGSTNKYTTIFSTSSNEEIVQEEIRTEMFDIFDISPERYHEYSNKARSGFQQHFVNRVVAEQLSNWCGRGAFNKKVPEFIYKGTPEIITEFLKCFWFGDGYVNQKLGYYGFYTVSKQLAYQLKMMLEVLGIYSSLRSTKTSGEFNGYSLEIWGKNSSMLAELFDSKIHKNTIREYQRTYTNTGMTYIPILSIEEEEYTGKVCNLEVENDNSYIANGVIVHNCGNTDAKHIDVRELGTRLGIGPRLIVSGNVNGIQTASDSKLNLVYNATDVGINSSLGEGWGLPNMEHAITGAPQIVPDHSACSEIYKDCGILIPTYADLMLDGGAMIVGRLVSPEAVAEAMEKIYTDKKLYKKLSAKSTAKFSADEYSWNVIGKKWDQIFESVL